jgi:hypothetical protein
MCLAHACFRRSVERAVSDGVSARTFDFKNTWSGSAGRALRVCRKRQADGNRRDIFCSYPGTHGSAVVAGVQRFLPAGRDAVEGGLVRCSACKGRTTIRRFGGKVASEAGSEASALLRLLFGLADWWYGWTGSRSACVRGMRSAREKIRMISARPATARERKKYEEEVRRG